MAKKKLSESQKTLAEAPQTHIYASDGKSYEVSLRDGDIWMSQKQMAELFGVTHVTVIHHIKNVIEQDGLDDSVCKKLLHTANDGKSYEVKFYNLKVIVPVGFRLNNSEQATRFRAWATSIIEKYLTIGVVVNEPLLESRAILDKQKRVDIATKAGYASAPEVMHSKAELDVARSLKIMNEMIKKVVANPLYDKIHNAKLQALFGLKSQQIKDLLECKNIHEGLPTMQLEYLDFAHKQIIHILQMQANGTISTERAIAGIEMVVKPLGEYLQNLCEQLGIHHVSGKPLLSSKN